MRDTAATLQTLLDEALRALAGGEAVEAERQAKAVSALVRAQRDVAELQAAEPGLPEEDEDARRAELRRRLARFIEASTSGAPDAVLERIATGAAGE